HIAARPPANDENFCRNFFCHWQPILLVIPGRAKRGEGDPGQDDNSVLEIFNVLTSADLRHHLGPLPSPLRGSPGMTSGAKRQSINSVAGCSSSALMRWMNSAAS